MYTPAPIAQSLVEAIQDPRAPAPVVRALAEALMADLDYAGWFLQQKSKLDENALLSLLAEYDTTMNACRQGWIAYQSGYSSSAEENVLRQVKHFQDHIRLRMSSP
jgi:hypothetical protein